MIEELQVEGKNILVVGLGRSGSAAVELLLNKGARVTAIDTKNEAEIKTDLNKLRRAGADIFAGDNSLKWLENKDLVVISPGIPLEHPIVREANRKNIKVTGELELAYNYCEGEVIAVTGTNGKSTTTSLIAHILSHAGIKSLAAGNIGLPFASIVPAQGKVVVVEVSSYQLETIERFRPHIAVWLNLTEDHLGRHGNLESYAKMKTRIFENQAESDFLVYNADDKLVSRYSKSAKSRLLPFSFSRIEGVFSENGIIHIDGNGLHTKVIGIERLLIRGRHNVENALAAAAATVAYGIEIDKIAAGLTSFKGIEHRQEFVLTCGGVNYVNDSKATNVDSGIQALETVEPPIILIAGGRGKGESFAAIGELLRRKVKILITIGEAAEQMARELSDFTELMYARDMHQAVRLAKENALYCDTVLLSPMCASFDMYEDFEERGRHFKACVREIVNGA